MVLSSSRAKVMVCGTAADALASISAWRSDPAPESDVVVTSNASARAPPDASPAVATTRRSAAAASARLRGGRLWPRRTMAQAMFGG